MSEWQPIETAPKDGTRILVCGTEIGCCVASASYRSDHHKPITWGVVNDIIVYPTHWMPLPEPPK